MLSVDLMTDDTSVCSRVPRNSSLVCYYNACIVCRVKLMSGCLAGLDKSKHNEPAYPVGGWASHYPIQIQQSNGIKKSEFSSFTFPRVHPVLFSPDSVSFYRL